MKIISVIMILMICFMLCGCGDPKVIKGVQYETYGLFNSDDVKSEAVKYKIIVGNVIWSVLLIETVVFPIYFIGFSLYEPISGLDK